MTLYFEDLHVGQTWNSEPRILDEADVSAFASLTGDFDPLHVPQATAGRSPYGKPIVHGLLGLSVMAGLSTTAPKVKTRALVSVGPWHFDKPIYFGDTVHVVTKVDQLEPYGRRGGRVIWNRELRNQDDVVVQQGKLETIVARREPLRSKSKGKPTTE